MLDGGCGDFNWMQKIVNNFDYYLGIDVVDEIINKNNELYKNNLFAGPDSKGLYS